MRKRTLWCLTAAISVSLAWGASLNLPDDDYQREARALTAPQVTQLAAQAAAGDAHAQCVVGIAYANGFRVAKDQAEAAKWLRRAAERNVSRAANDL